MGPQSMNEAFSFNLRSYSLAPTPVTDELMAAPLAGPLECFTRSLTPSPFMAPAAYISDEQ